MASRLASFLGRPAWAASLACAAALALSAPASALDAKLQAQPAAPLPADSFKSAKDALQSGVKNLNAGNPAGAVRALEYAAGQGNVAAALKLGQMYAEGEGVPQDDVKAFEHYKTIYDQFADEAEDSPNAGAVSMAYVALGSYLVQGIPNSYVKPNPFRARELFDYAATIYRDPNAQYNLAMLQLDGVGGPKEPRKAVRWLNLAAEKGHVQAQAVLGNLLFFGDSSKQKPRGLMWLMLARDGADTKRDAWILELHGKATAQATESDRTAALAMLEQQMRRRP
ncbi:tetratricopeptide repeat protein [Alsobacter sp. R-9]